MAVHYKTEGIVIKKSNWGESDQLLTFYTKDFGRLELLGRSIRKIKSKLRASADIFYLSEIEFIQGKSYKTLTEAEPIAKFENIKKNPEKFVTVFKILEVLSELINGEEKDKKIWGLLNENFEKLNNCLLPVACCKLVYYYFLWNLFSTLGYQINLHNCAICQKKLIPDKLYFTAGRGIVCLKCSAELKNKNEISPEIIKIIRVLIKGDWQMLKKLKIEELYINKLETISSLFFSYIKSGHMI
jgi:DNA repair protein RecO (recombination protein O)